MKILVLNCGSSSVKYKLFDMATKQILGQGGAEKVGMKGVLMLEKNNLRYNKKFLAIKNLMQLEETIKNKC